MPESPHETWLPEAHRTAQTSAMVWAERADEAYHLAQRYQDRAASWTPNAAHAEVIENERKEAREHSTRCTEAIRLAEMWARVAAVLVPPLEPMEAVLEAGATTEGTPLAAHLYNELSPQERQAVDAWRGLGCDLATALLNAGVVRPEQPPRNKES